jgi:hypothetical protein
VGAGEEGVGDVGVWFGAPHPREMELPICRLQMELSRMAIDCWRLKIINSSG